MCIMSYTFGYGRAERELYSSYKAKLNAIEYKYENQTKVKAKDTSSEDIAFNRFVTQ